MSEKSVFQLVFVVSVTEHSFIALWVWLCAVDMHAPVYVVDDAMTSKDSILYTFISHLCCYFIEIDEIQGM